MDGNHQSAHMLNGRPKTGEKSDVRNGGWNVTPR